MGSEYHLTPTTAGAASLYVHMVSEGWCETGVKLSFQQKYDHDRDATYFGFQADKPH